MENSLNAAPSSERVRIGIFGCMNAGKSSIINALTAQETAVVSDVPGTTTDTVSKTMELLPLGPVILTDTPGLDDKSSLAAERIRRARAALDISDIAIVVVDAARGIGESEKKLLELIEQKGIEHLIVYNKTDLGRIAPGAPKGALYTSCHLGEGIGELKERLAAIRVKEGGQTPIIADRVNAGDIIVLVIPIDGSAPKGRLIMPQQQTIRELLEAGAVPLCVRDIYLKDTLDMLYGRGIRPALVITDSQVFEEVAVLLPADIPLTSFSILMARHKGNLKDAIKGAGVIDTLRDGDVVIISEGCTHHRKCGDIGSVKLPAWIKKHTGKSPEIVLTSGHDFADDETLGRARLVIHCGGCMLSEKQMRQRYEMAGKKGLPITNYGIAIAHMKGILGRATEFVCRMDKD